MEVESEVGQGTTFTVRLPIFEDVKEGDAETVEDRSGRSGKILLVEDDEMTCEVLQRILSPKHTVEVARNGMDALQTFTPGRFAEALIDLGIPTVPGDNVANMREQAPPLVTVLVTGWVLEEGDDRLSSFDLHLQKPVLGPDLEDIVAEAIVLHDSRV